VNDGVGQLRRSNESLSRPHTEVRKPGEQQGRTGNGRFTAKCQS